VQPPPEAVLAFTLLCTGALIGSGSFGKVFKGQWNGMDVAVKVIEHSGTSAAAVQHELGLMLSLQHPNIVRWALIWPVTLSLLH